MLFHLGSFTLMSLYSTLSFQLYALVTLPPLRTCNSTSFDTLWSNFVTNAATLTTDVLSASLTILFESFTCLGVTCELVGIPDDIILDIDFLPSCTDPQLDTNLLGYEGVYERMLEVRSSFLQHV